MVRMIPFFKNICDIVRIFIIVVFFSCCLSHSAEANPEIIVDCGKCSTSISNEIKQRTEILRTDIFKVTGLDLKNSILIEIASNNVDFAKRAGDGAPEWAVAIYSDDKIVIRQEGLVIGSDGRFFNILEHEIVHAMLDDMFFADSRRLPRWLNEGIAVSVSGDWEAPSQWDRRKTVLRSAIKRGVGFSFEDLSSGFPGSSWLAEVAYAQSVDMTQFLLKRGGWKKMMQLLELLASGNDIETAFEKNYGENFTDISEEWYAYAGRPGGAEIVMHILVNIEFYIWIGMIFLMLSGVLAVVLRRRKNQQNSDEYDPEEDWDELDEKWDRDLFGDRPWRPGRRE